MDNGDELFPLLLRVREAYHRHAPRDAARWLAAADQVLGRTEIPTSDPVHGWLNVWRARIAEREGRFEEAQEAASRGVSLARHHDWPEVRAHALRTLAAVLSGAGDEAGAEPVARRALVGFQDLGDTVEEAYATALLARIRLEQGRLEEAQELVEPGLTVLREADDPRATEATALLAEILRRGGEVATAGMQLLDALTGLPPDAVHDRLVLTTHLASTAMSAGRFEEAVTWAEEANALLPEEVVDTVMGARVANLVGEARRVVGDLDGAEEAYRQALAGLGNHAHALEARINLALLALARQDWSTAADELDRVLLTTRRRGVLGLVHTIRLAACAGQGDVASWRHHYARSTTLLAESPTADRDVALCARQAGAQWAEGGIDDPLALARAVRAHAIALGQWTRLGDPDEAVRERELLRTLGERGAPVPAGPWDLLEPLGQGAMGEVWRALHHVRAFEAAVKLLLADAGQDELLRAGIDSEVAAVATLDHPHIVRVLGHGLLDDIPALVARDDREHIPFFAMEIARGGTLDDLVGELSWVHIRDVLANLLDALAHAHARGVVHLDLKPANVLLDEIDGALHPRLTDFGVAGVVQALRGVRGVVGTPQYMAPEQFRGQVRSFGPWTDLYALGCLAWHLVCGEPPFEGENVGDLREQQLSDSPPPLEPLMGVPPEFEAWLKRLLEKDPGDRFQRAADAAWALRGLTDPAPSEPMKRRKRRLATSASTWALPSWADEELEEVVVSHSGPQERDLPPMPAGWRGPPRPPPPSAALALDLAHLRRVPVVGRDRHRRLLWATLADVRRHARPRLIALEGPMGSGRSALLRWLCEAAHERGVAEILAGRCEGGGLKDLFVRHLDAEGLDAAGVEHRVQAVAPQISGADRAAIVDLVAGDGSLPTTEACARLVSAAGAVRPAILALSGAPLVELDVMEVVEHLLRIEAPALVVLEVPSGRDRVVDRRYESLLDLPNAMVLPVDAPTPGLVADIIHERLPLDEELVSSVVDRAEGNLHYAMALLDDLVDRDALVEGPTGLSLRPGVVLDLPRRLEERWTSRLEGALAGMPEPARDALTVCALAGTEVSPTVWRGVCDSLTVPSPSAVMRRLRTARLVEPTPDRGWAFAHPALVQLLRADVADPGHLADLATIATEQFGIVDDARLGDLLVDAGDLEEALAPLERAAGAAFGRLDLAEAERLLARRADSMRGLGLPEDDPRWIAQLVQTAEVSAIRGVLPSLRAPLARAAEQAEQQGLHTLHARALGRLADLTRRDGDLQEADALLRQAAAAFRAADAPEGWAHVRHQMGMSALHRGDVEGAALHFEKGLRRTTSPELAALLRVGLAWVATWREHDDDAEAGFRAELPDTGPRSASPVQAACHTGLALLAVRQGRLDHASEHYDLALRATPAAAHAWRRAIELDRCLVALARGDLHGTAQEAERVVAWSRDALSPDLETWARVLTGPDRITREDGTRWLDEVSDALHRSMRVTPDLAGVLEITARCATRAGQPHRARRVWELAEAQWRTLGNRQRAHAAREQARQR